MEEVYKVVEEVKVAMNEHVDLVSDLLQRVSSELRSGFAPAVDNLLGFFHAIDWKEPWLIGLLSFYVVLLLVVIFSRRRVNFQLFLSFLAFLGVYMAERINTFLGENWKSFSSQNYFDPSGVFISVLWSGPLILITVLIVVNTLITLCGLMVRWKRAELRHRARQARAKKD
ncbi:tmem18 [Carex rostrata]